MSASLITSSPVAVSPGSGWERSGTLIRLMTSTDDVVVGGIVSLGKFGVVSDTAGEKIAVFRAAVVQTASVFVIQDSAGIDRFEMSAKCLSGNNTCLGLSAGDSITTGTANVAVGGGALDSLTSGDNNTAVGFGCMDSLLSGGFNSALGTFALMALSSGGSNTGVGYNVGAALSTGSANILLGRNANVDAGADSNNFVAGSSAQPINNVWFGRGMSNATPTAYTINGTSGNAAGITGANIQIAGGKGGAAADAGGNVTFFTAAAGSGTTLTERVRIASSGNVGIGTTDFGSGTGVVGLANASVVPSVNPVGGGVFYPEGGALKWRSPGGLVTTIAVN